MKEPYIVPIRVYTFIFFALMALLALTFGVAHLPLGRFGIVAALLIAGTKAMLVVLYFMHIRYESGLHRVMAGVGVFWLGILIVLSLSDYLTRDWLSLPGHWPQ